MQHIADEVIGDDWTYTIYDLVDVNGNPVTDLTNWQCDAHVFDRPGGTALISRSTTTDGIARTTGDTGPAFEITIPATLNQSLTPGTYYMPIAVTSPEGQRRTAHRISLRTVR